MFSLHRPGGSQHLGIGRFLSRPNNERSAVKTFLISRRVTRNRWKQTTTKLSLSLSLLPPYIFCGDREERRRNLCNRVPRPTRQRPTEKSSQAQKNQHNRSLWLQGWWPWVQTATPIQAAAAAAAAASSLIISAPTVNLAPIVIDIIDDRSVVLRLFNALIIS